MSEEPRLVTKDGDRKTPSEATLTRSDFLEMVKLMVGGMQDAMTTQAAAQNEKTDALALLIKKSKEEMERNDQHHMLTFKNISVFNPRGDNAEAFPDECRKRDLIKGEVLWVGTRLIWHECTYEELVLLNQLESGTYHGGEWIVKDMEPDVKGSRKLYVQFPNLDPDKRAELPNGYWDANAKDENGQPLVGMDLNNPLRKGRQVTGMEMMLREMVEEAASRKQPAVA